MDVLTLSSASGGCEVAIVSNGCVAVVLHTDAENGLAAHLPHLAGEILANAARPPDCVAVIVGPGSFTGIRAGVAVANGVALGLGIPAHGVTIAEALASTWPPTGRYTLWTAVAARRNRVFIDRGDGFSAWPEDAPPVASGPVAVCGNAANAVAAALAARGTAVLLTSVRRPQPEQIAAICLQRSAGLRAALPPVPLYIDAPEARLPAGGLRTAPL